MANYQCLAAQVGYSKPGPLCVSAKTEEHFYLLRDGPILVQAPIHIVDRDRLG